MICCSVRAVMQTFTDVVLDAENNVCQTVANSAVCRSDVSVARAVEGTNLNTLMIFITSVRPPVYVEASTWQVFEPE